MVPPPVLAAYCGTQPLLPDALQACTNRVLFQSTAKIAMRIRRLVLIGQICRKLSEQDAAIILKNSIAEMEEARASLSGEDRNWSKTWLEGLATGTMQTVDPAEQDEASCDRFAKPGGPLTKIMTWTGKPQYVGGIIASPRTIP